MASYGKLQGILSDEGHRFPNTLEARGRRPRASSKVQLWAIEAAPMKRVQMVFKNPVKFLAPNRLKSGSGIMDLFIDAKEISNPFQSQDVLLLQAILDRTMTGLANRVNCHFGILTELNQKPSGYRARATQTTLAVNNNIVTGSQ